MSMTQCQRLLDYLNRYGSITPMEAWEHLGIYRLSGRINDLRKDYTITTQMVEVENMWGEKCRVAEYTLVRVQPNHQPDLVPATPPTLDIHYNGKYERTVTI